MQIQYEEDFVEAAVFMCTSGRRKGAPPLQVARFDREREKLYTILDPDERNEAFFKLHLEWFHEWELEDLLTRPVREFPLLLSELKILAFRKARANNDEGAELYVNTGGDRNGVVAMRPERLGLEPEMVAFLRHELMHLHDMVDPAFGYSPELPRANRFPARYRLALERYRLLWDVSIDGRLARRRPQTSSAMEPRWREFTAGFSFWPEGRQRTVFNLLWSEPAVTHAMLVALVCDPRAPQPGGEPGPGSPCPLCGFPTFSWADPRTFTDRVVEQIRSEFAHWAPEAGACARCVETFRVRRPQPPVVV